MKLGSIRDIKVSVHVELCRRELTLGEIARLGEGLIIGFDSLAGEPVDLVANGETIAKVVVIDENFGLRVTKMVEKER
jgi:flagellar motor switch protein FliN/FliY